MFTSLLEAKKYFLKKRFWDFDIVLLQHLVTLFDDVDSRRLGLEKNLASHYSNFVNIFEEEKSLAAYT